MAEPLSAPADGLSAELEDLHAQLEAKRIEQRGAEEDASRAETEHAVEALLQEISEVSVREALVRATLLSLPLPAPS